jgi:hypothetical protein
VVRMTTITIPDSLEYPEILPLKDVPALKNVLCYVIKAYPIDGIGVVITRDDEWLCSRISDFKGNILEPNDAKYSNMIEHVMTKYIPYIMSLMQCANMDKLLFYFADLDDPRLVDVRVSFNKFCSPGFVKDIFGKVVPVQEDICKPIVLNAENMERLCTARGDYSSGNFILKPTAFKTIIRDGKILPLYGVINNEVVDDA